MFFPHAFQVNEDFHKYHRFCLREGYLSFQFIFSVHTRLFKTVMVGQLSAKILQLNCFTCSNFSVESQQ